MRFKYVIASIIVSMFLSVGCASNKASNNEKEVKSEAAVIVMENSGDISNGGSDDSAGDGVISSVDEEINTSADETTIQDELALIEEKSLAFDNDNWDIPQQEMNSKSGEWYMLWDDELNSLWSRLSSVLDEQAKNEILAEQRDWIKRKEQNVIASGMSAYGGSMQPLLENTTAEQMTRKRAYELAGYLAKEMHEKYDIPSEVEASFKEVDVSLEYVFEAFKGEHEVNDGVYVKILPTSDTSFTEEGYDDCTWAIWPVNNTVLTDKDVYAYTIDEIVFEKDNIYYELCKSWDSDEILLHFGENLTNLSILL